MGKKATKSERLDHLEREVAKMSKQLKALTAKLDRKTAVVEKQSMSKAAKAPKKASKASSVVKAAAPRKQPTPSRPVLVEEQIVAAELPKLAS